VTRRDVRSATRLALATLAITAWFATAQSVAAQSVAQWSLASQPSVVIGEPTRSDELLSRVVGLALAPTGEVILWEPNSSGVRIFSRDGASSRVLARTGAGPGEVRDARWIGMAGDTIVVIDGTLRRITRITVAGRVLSTVDIRSATSALGARPVGRLQDGSLAWLSVDPAYDGTVTGVRRDSITVALSTSDGGSLRPVTRVPGTATFTARTSSGGMVIGELPFGTKSLVAAGRAHVWILDNAATVVRGYTTSGGLAHTWRVPVMTQTITPAHIAAARARELEQLTADPIRRIVQQKFAAAPSITPTISGIAVAPNGDLWLTTYVADVNQPAAVLVMTETGVQRASLRLPAGFRVLNVGESNVIGIHRDEDDVETVRVYPYRRTP
jgi:hypothetical protein